MKGRTFRCAVGLRSICFISRQLVSWREIVPGDILCRRLNSLLKNSMSTGFEGAQLQLRRYKSFKFVIPRRLQPPRDPRFEFFSKL